MIEIFSDAATVESIEKAASNPSISGVTTNPTLLSQAGVSNYRDFVSSACEMLSGKPLSVEVLSVTPTEVFREALEISSWGKNLFVKVPVITPKGESLFGVIQDLCLEGIRLNITAVFTDSHLESALESSASGREIIVSIFAGRIADTLRDPAPIFRRGRKLMLESNLSGTHKLLWASTRQIFDIVSAESCGAQIITIPPSLLSKLDYRDYDLEQFSKDTAQMFYEDGINSRLSVF